MMNLLFRYKQNNYEKVISIVNKTSLLFLLLLFFACDETNPTNNQNTIYVHDTVYVDRIKKDTVLKVDTIYASRFPTYLSTLISKPIVDSAWEYYSSSEIDVRVFWKELSGALGYRVYFEVPNTGTFEVIRSASKTTHTSFPGCWELCIPKNIIKAYVSRPLVIKIYVLGVDINGADGPVSDPYSYMFYP